MKSLDAHQVQTLIEYLNSRIDRHRNAAEGYSKEYEITKEMLAEAQAAEADCALAYLLGLIHG